MKILTTLSKRGLALFLVLTMCMSLLPATALAAELEIPQDASVEVQTPAEVQALLDASANMEAAYQALLNAIDARGPVADEGEFYAVFGGEFSALFDCSNAFDDAYDALPVDYIGYPGVAEAVASAGDIKNAFYDVQTLAIYPDTTKTVTYKFLDADGKEISGAGQILKSGEYLQVPAAPAIRDKRFADWVSSNPQIAADLTADAESVKVTFPESIEDGLVITYTAQYVGVCYVTFAGNDGKVYYTAETDEDGKVDMDAAAAAFNAYGIAPGETLAGWTTTQNGAVVNFYGTDVTANITVYPVTVTGKVFLLDGNGGILANGINRVDVGTTPEAPTRTGYTFAGWYTERDGGALVSSGFQANETYYAHWNGQPVNYTVIYWEENANDDGYSYRESKTQTGIAGTTASPDILSANPGFQPGTLRENVTIAGDGTTIVNVDYQRQAYKLTFMNGNKTYKIIEAKYEAYIGDQWPSNYQWLTTKNGSTTRAYIEIMPLNGQFVSQDGTKDSGTYYADTSTGNTKLIREIWMEKPDGTGYDHVRDITINGSSSSGIAAWPSFDGYTLNKQKSHPTNSDGSGKHYWSEGEKVYSGWTIISCAIKGYYDLAEYPLAVFVDGKEDTILSSTRKYGQAINLNATPNVSGKTFEGWYLDPLFTESADEVLKGTMPIGGVTVYAKMTTGNLKISVSCEVNIDGQTDFPSITAYVPVGTMIDQHWLENQLAGAGYTNIPWATEFRGWQVNGKFTVLPVIATDHMLLTGIWNGTTYTLTYVDADGKTVIETDRSGYVKDAMAPVMAHNNDTKGGVDYWIDTSTNQQYVPGSSVPMSGNVTLKAHYREVNVADVTIRFDANGGSGTMNDVSAANNDTVALPANTFTRDGYAFKGWATSPNGTTVEFQDQAKVVVDATGSNTLYAVWEKAQYTITVEVENGTANPAATSATVEYGGSYAITFTANQGYALDTVTVDGQAAVLTNSAYTFSNVQDNHTIKVVYAEDKIGTDPEKPDEGDGVPDKYQVTVLYESADPNQGTVTGTTKKVFTLGKEPNYASSGTITPGTDGVEPKPNIGYAFDGWNENPTVPKSVEGGDTITYTAQWEVDVLDAKDNNTTGGDGIPDKYQAVVQFVSAENGSVSGPTTQVFTFGTEPNYALSGEVTPAKVTATPSEGYKFSHWTRSIEYPAGSETYEVELTGTDTPERSMTAQGGMVITYKAYFARELKVTVKYLLNGTKIELRPEESVTLDASGAYNATIWADKTIIATNEGAYYGKQFALVSHDSLTGTADKDTEVKLYYALDEWDADGDSLTGGDGTADMYQAVIKYEIAPDAARNANAGKLSKELDVVTLTDTAGNPAESGTATASSTVTSYLGSGYAFAEWKTGDTHLTYDKDLSDSFTAQGNTTYTYTATFLEDKKGGESDPGTTPDGIPDAWQVFVDFKLAADSTNIGYVFANTQVYNLGNGETSGDVKPTLEGVDAVPVNRNLYTLDKWTKDNETAAVDPGSKLENVAGGTTVTFYAHFAEDKINKDNPDQPGPDGIPDKYEVVVTFKIAKIVDMDGAPYRGQWSDGATADKKAVVVLTDANGSYSETGSGKLETAQIPTAAPNTAYGYGGTEKWTMEGNGVFTAKEEAPATTTDIKAATTYTVSWDVQKTSYSIVQHFIDRKGNEVHTTEPDVKQAERGASLLSLVTSEMKAARTHESMTYLYDAERSEAPLANRVVTEGAVIHLYYDIDALDKNDPNNPGADGIADKNEIIFTYVANNNGSLTGNMEEILAKGENGAASPSSVPTPNANTGYAFDFWQTGDAKDFAEGMSTLKSVSYTEDTQFTASFDKDDIGERNPDEGDGIPDKYQITFTYVAAAGGNVEGTLKEVVTRRDAYGNPSETAAVSPEANVTATADANYTFSKWTVGSDPRFVYGTAVEIQAARFSKDVEFTANFEPNAYSLTIEYRLEDADGAELIDKFVSDPIHTYDVNGIDAHYDEITATKGDNAGKHFVLIGNSGNLSGTLTQDTVVQLYYSLDELNGKDNTLTGGDDIPDKYQVTVLYESANIEQGIVTGTTKKVFTLGVEPNYATSGTITPSTQGVTPTPTTGYVFDKWDEDPDVEKDVTGGETYIYKATWAVDRNDNGVDDSTEYRTVTYTDGADDSVFANVVITENADGQKLLDGDATPAFTGSTNREGYVFIGWTPEVAEKVSGSVIYTAQWDEDKIGTTNPDEGDGIPDKYQATVTFTVVNGTWAGGATTSRLVVTLLNESGEPAENGTYTLTSNDIPNGTANNGFSDNGAWGTSGNPLNAVIRRGGASFTLTYAPAGSGSLPAPDPGPGIIIPNPPTPLAPTPGDDITIIDEEVPLANAVGLNDTDHFAYIIGYEDDTVRPLNNITRAEAVTIFFRLMEDEYRAANWSTENSFSDVNVGNWYNNAVSTCLKAGALEHFAQDDAFLPNQAITRAEFASIAAGFVSDDITGENVGDFSDTEGHWAAEAIRKAVAAGWINGVGGNKFAPDETITRAEVMTMINRMLDRVPDVEHMLPTMKKWSDNPESAWYYEAVQEATNDHAYERDEMGIIETWTELKTNRDWTSLEAEWAANGGASTPVEPVQPVEGESGEEIAETESEDENP